MKSQGTNSREPQGETEILTGGGGEGAERGNFD